MKRVIVNIPQPTADMLDELGARLRMPGVARHHVIGLLAWQAMERGIDAGPIGKSAPVSGKATASASSYTPPDWMQVVSGTGIKEIMQLQRMELTDMVRGDAERAALVASALTWRTYFVVDARTWFVLSGPHQNQSSANAARTEALEQQADQWHADAQADAELDEQARTEGPHEIVMLGDLTPEQRATHPGIQPTHADNNLAVLDTAAGVVRWIGGRDAHATAEAERVRLNREALQQ